MYIYIYIYMSLRLLPHRIRQAYKSALYKIIVFIAQCNFVGYRLHIFA